ncbi:HD family phosphohydrolase [Amycolatopsis taiwanensis]|uniref:HD family phosphohydrolase n=1 Tax=Amycolatopsis taiwanensis TaxID=342230 RepID=A0A9W6VC92_9PSEU|nr:HD family phosphohydrolase [Amycolatopsis taiwanensis]GLY65888.1 HD family phosphohydrolase [Amycolatopsis taiwanensis]
MHAQNIVAARALSETIITTLEKNVHKLCLRYAERLPFHGWHHVCFVRAKAADFARLNGANVHVVEASALVHDVNYLIRRNSPAAAGRDLRLDLLLESGVPSETAEWIDRIVDEAEMATRGPDISLEAQALSDADTLFKALPITPVMLAHRYLAENDITLRELANKIVGEQRGVHDGGYYFYNPAAAETYSRWALANLELWQCIREAVDDPAVEDLLDAIGVQELDSTG